MFSRLVISLFIIFFIFIFLVELINAKPSFVEGMNTNTDDSSTSTDSSNIGIIVGKYTSKIDQLGKTIDSMQAKILELLPIVTKNTQDNQKNQQAIQSIIANKDKT